MIKKILKTILILILVIPIIYFGIYLTQNFINTKALEGFNGQKIGEANDDIIRCNFNIIEPEYAYVFYDYEGNISFDKINKVFWNAEDWKTSSTGGTTIKNTTFPELVEMVKEDCSQFQENFDAEDPETQIDWGYREAEPPKTQEELKKEKEEEYYSMYNQYIDFSDEVKNLIRERYGDWENTEYDELLELSLQVAEDEEIGRMANPQWYEMMDQMDEDEEL